MTGYQRVTGAKVGPNGNDPKTATATCPSGKVLGGGYLVTDSSNPQLITVTQSQPTSDTTWTVVAREGADPGNWSLTAYAICGNAGP